MDSALRQETTRLPQPDKTAPLPGGSEACRGVQHEPKVPNAKTRDALQRTYEGKDLIGAMDWRRNVSRVLGA